MSVDGVLIVSIYVRVNEDIAWKYEQAKKKKKIARRKHLTTKGECYVVQSGNRGPIKIGWSQNVTKRFKSLQTACPFKLTILAIMPGTRLTEKSLQQQFASLRLRGEWFKPAPQLLRAIKLILTKP